MEQNGVLYSACLVLGYFPCHEFKYSMKYLVNKYITGELLGII